MNKRVVVGILSYIIFIYWCTTHTTTTNTSATNNTLFASSVTLSKDDNSPRIRVLIARAVGPSEAQNVIDDVQHDYFNTHDSKSQCNRIQETNEIDPFANSTEAFPNHILCESNFVLPQVDVEYLIFARNADVAKQIDNACNSSSISNVEVIDVTGDTIKVWNWINYIDEDRLIGFDYAAC